MDLKKVAQPWTAANSEIPKEWAQGAFYKQPVIADRIEDLIGRISLFTVGESAVLRTFDPREGQNVRELLRPIEIWKDSFAVSLSPPSPSPVETGYLECMHLTPAADGITVEDALTAFMQSQREQYGDMEPYLRGFYGKLTPQQQADRRFDSIDYPVFDLGSVSLGFGLFAEYARFRSLSIWCWSRVVNWHK